METSLFTVIMEFDGTTSVSQFAAQGITEALRLWIAGLSQSNAYGLSGSSARQLAMAFAEDRERCPTPIDGVENVWCSTALAEGQLALLNIVKTCH
jgi:hypothetical protein